MADIVESKFRDWTRGKNKEQARIAVYNQIRDIHYAIIPELNDTSKYVEILELNRGSCTPKHFLLCDMFQRLGLLVLYVVYQYRWDEFESLYPPDLKQQAKEMPLGSHLACKVDIEGKLVLVDATLDPALAIAGLPVNKEWDGLSDTLLPINPCSGEQLYHPSEAKLLHIQQFSDNTQAFYNGLNSWMDLLRSRSCD